MLEQILLILSLLCSLTSAKDVDEAELEAKFKVNHVRDPIDVGMAHQLMDLKTVTDANGTYEIMRVNNQDVDILCYIPQVDSSAALNKLIGEETSEGGDKGNRIRSDDELLDEILPHFVRYFDAQKCMFTTGLNDAYWTYGYCFGDKAIQFHENLNTFKKTGVHAPEFPNHVFVLGRFDDIDGTKEVSMINQSTGKSRKLHKKDFSIINDPLKPSGPNTKKPQKALHHVLNNGGLCDLTNEPRTVEVIYRCDSNFKGIVRVSEIKTCNYQMIINLGGLCSIDEFAPSDAENKPVDVVCKDVVPTVESQDIHLKQLPEFPRPQTTKVDVQHFKLQPGGNGFFWGRPIMNNDFYDRRTVVFYNDDISENRQFIHEFSRMFSNSVESKIRSPDSSDGEELVTWDDFFTVWYEVYDLHGNFLNVMKVARVGALDTKGLSLRLVDPFSMTDQDGDPVEPPQPSGNRMLYEYESFTKGTTKFTGNQEIPHPMQQPMQLKQPIIPNEAVDTSTVTVTMPQKPTESVDMEDVFEVVRKRLGIDENQLLDLIDEFNADMDEIDNLAHDQAHNGHTRGAGDYVDNSHDEL